MTKDILINELFASVQGEGQYVGTPMLFIRTSTCNLRCAWCDQPDSVAQGFRGRDLKYVQMTPDNIMQWVTKQLDYKHVCLTGGEPTLQDLSPLVNELQTKDYKVHVETNGTRAPDWLYKVDHVCLSPKPTGAVHEHVWDLAKEVKIIVDADTTWEYIQEALDKVEVPVYLQPANHLDSLDKDNLSKALSLVYRDPWQLRLSIQLHKVLGVH